VESIKKAVLKDEFFKFEGFLIEVIRIIRKRLKMMTFQNLLTF